MSAIINQYEWIKKITFFRLDIIGVSWQER